MEAGMQPQGEFEDAGPSSSMCEPGSTGPVVAMVACNVILLLMLAACSPPAHAQVLALQASGANASAVNVAVPIERLTVVPSPEDRPPPVKGRWQRFEEALNASRSRGHRVVESRTSTGSRTSCYEPCVNDCCASSGGFSLAGHRVGH